MWCVDALKWWKKEGSAYHLHSAGISQLSTRMDQWFCASRNFVRRNRQGSMQHIAYDIIAERVSGWKDIQAENLREEGVQRQCEGSSSQFYSSWKNVKRVEWAVKSGRMKRQSVTVHKMPLGACMQALQEEKPVELLFHKCRQGRPAWFQLCEFNCADQE